MDIKKAEPTMPMMPMLPELFANAMPVLVPPMRWEQNIVSKIFHNFSLGRMAKAADLEKQIDESKSQSLQARLQMVEDMVTFSDRVKARFHAIQHDIDMRDILKNKGLMENQILFYQAKNEEMDFLMKEKAWKEMNGEQT